MIPDSRRLEILTAREIEELYGRPRFTDDDRRLYFDLSAAEREALALGAVHTGTAMHLALQIGYFKAKRQFFVYELEAVRTDLQYLLSRYCSDREHARIKALSKPTRLEQQQIILRLFDYRRCDDTTKAELALKARRIAMLSTQPITILREALRHLENQRIVAPGYTFMQDLVSRVVTGERRRITEVLGQAMTPTMEQRLAALLKADEGMACI